MLEKDILGDRLHVSAFTIRGHLTVANCGQLMEDIIRRIGMTTAHGSTVCHYPVSGLGGIGFTIFQPITQSFLVLDCWPEADIPHAFLVVASCKSFTNKEVEKVIIESGFILSEQIAQVLLA